MQNTCKRKFLKWIHNRWYIYSFLLLPQKRSTKDSMLYLSIVIKVTTNSEPLELIPNHLINDSVRRQFSEVLNYHLFLFSIYNHEGYQRPYDWNYPFIFLRIYLITSITIVLLIFSSGCWMFPYVGQNCDVLPRRSFLHPFKFFFHCLMLFLFCILVNLPLWAYSSFLYVICICNTAS